jgi:hypothetical protein
MKTTYYTDRNGAKEIVNGLTDIFRTKEENKEIEKTYSLGFVRYYKLSKGKKLEAFKCLFIEGFGSGIKNQNELKSRLEKMTEEEFKNFKK